MYWKKFAFEIENLKINEIKFYKQQNFYVIKLMIAGNNANFFFFNNIQLLCKKVLNRNLKT